MKLTKTTISKAKYFLLALLVAFSFSCSPEDGEDGAAGPAGTDGNANVFASEWISATYTIQGANRQFFNMSAPEVTQDIIDTGQILFYGRPNNNNVLNVPVVVPNHNQTFSVIIGSPGYIGIVRILCDAIDTSAGISNPYLNSYRYIIIPSNNSEKNSIDYTKMSYEEIIKHFNLD